MSAFDVFSVRGLYTSLGDGWTYLNAHATPQIPEKVSSAVSRAFRLSTSVTHPELGPAPRHNMSVGMTEGANFIRDAKVAVADLVGGSADCVVLGPSLPVLYDNLARAMHPMWRHRSSVVVAAGDDQRLNTPFEYAEPEVRYAQSDLGTGEVPAWQYQDLVDGSTRLVSLSTAHGLLGTVTDVPAVVDKVRERSRAWVVVDASVTAPYRPIDFDALGADIIALDITQMGGPQLAAMVFRDRLMFQRLDSIVPGYTASDAGRLDTPISSGLAGGVGPIVDHYARLASGEGTRRTKLLESMGHVQHYMDGLTRDLYMFLGSLPEVHILGVTGEAAEGASTDRVPRMSFAVNGVSAKTVQQRLFDNRLVTGLTPLVPPLIDMGVEDIGGTVTVGLGPFNTTNDVNHLIRVVASLA